MLCAPRRRSRVGTGCPFVHKNNRQGAALSPHCPSQPTPASNPRAPTHPHPFAPQSPRWSLFCATTAVSAAVFSSTIYYLLGRWSILSRDGSHPASAFSDPVFLGAAAAALASLLHLLALGGVFFIHSDVAAVRQGAARARTPLPPVGWDSDVVVVGAGTAGAALGAVLGREGAAVTLVEKYWGSSERIVGELLQPGGLAALGRMGLADAATCPAIDAVPVEGYVVLAPGGGPLSDVVLSYPAAVPSSTAEIMGVWGKDASPRPISVLSKYLEGQAPSEVDPAHPSLAYNRVASGALGSGASGSRAGDSSESSLPRGRSFWNHTFVHGLRCSLLECPSLSPFSGNVTGLVFGKDVLEGRLPLRSSPALLGGGAPPPKFPGYDEKGEPLPLPAGATGGEVGTPAPIHPSLLAWAAADPEAVMGITWTDAAGTPRCTLAPLTVMADGMYSGSRKSLHAPGAKPRTASYFCGLLLNHAAGESPLPYPGRGHVILADPNPVLLYQISTTQTRVLVDVPEDVYERVVGEGGCGLAAHFADVIAPQLPPILREPFLLAARTQAAQCMANRALSSAPPAHPGAVLVGDSWNMRHPLTGGGMTVALRDVECVVRALDTVPQLSCAYPRWPRSVDGATTRSPHPTPPHQAAPGAMLPRSFRPSRKPGNRTPPPSTSSPTRCTACSPTRRGTTAPAPGCGRRASTTCPWVGRPPRAPWGCSPAFRPPPARW